MFSNALKSFTSNISNNYTISPEPSSSSGPWRIFDAKRKQTGKAISVFIFDKRSLEPPGGSLAVKDKAISLKKAHEEVVERLKKEGSSLARLRHPSILELREPVEETRNGGLMFATEPVTASLGELLRDKDDQEKSGAEGGRGRRYAVKDVDDARHRHELEIDELEIQKGLLQLSKGLEFLHESAGLVHANLTPEAIVVNAKGDWKISGLSFCGSHESSNATTTLPSISLSEVLKQDPRLPRIVQLNLDYTSPDFVLDNRLTASADMFSLGLLILSLYNSPHKSPLSTGSSLSAYKRLFSTPSCLPTQNNNFLIPSSHPLPPKLVSDLLSRLVTRRPAQRLSAREFQEANYFDNILVSTIRFLDALPAKTVNEKTQFMRGLPRIMPQFSKSVLEKKVLPALIEEMKDLDLLAPIMSCLFTMVKAMPSGKRAFTDKVVPKLRDTFIVNHSSEKDTGKDAGLMVLLENMETAAANCQGKEFREGILPIILLALESSTHSIVDAALGTLPFVLQALDFSTIKNELFPATAVVFAKTSSLNIKVRGLEAFYTLCGGSASTDSVGEDDLSGISISESKSRPQSSSATLDKFTVQEKIVPLLKGIKTKEPGVMMAALRVFGQVGNVADSDFLAIDVLPTLWSMSLGPLLNLQQFQAFMVLIKTLSSKIEREQTKKLQDLGANNGIATVGASGANEMGIRNSYGISNLTNGDETDFETLVSGRKQTPGGNDDLMNDWVPSIAAKSATNRSQSSRPANHAPVFSWQSQSPQAQATVSSIPALRAPTQSTRAITPDETLSSFAALTPASQFSQPLQPSQNMNSPSFAAASSMRTTLPPHTFPNIMKEEANVAWSARMSDSASVVASQRPMQSLQPQISFGTISKNASLGGFSLSPPPISSPSARSLTSPSSSGRSIQSNTNAVRQLQQQQPQQQPQQQSKGLDKYESLL